MNVSRLANVSQNVWPGDFNGDGRTDLAASADATSDGGGGRVLVVLGNGSGTFGAPIATDFVGHVVNVGDFDKDGKSDLVVVDEARTQVAILPGRGDGTFGAAVAVYEGSDITFALGADFDGDGHRDLALAYEGYTALVFPGRGDLMFDTPVTLTTGAFPADGIATDVNGDGRRDLIIANRYDAVVSVFLNQGAMLFTAADVEVEGGSDVTVADFNGDGKPDLAVAANGGGDGDTYFREGHAAILLGNGDGTFGQPVSFPTAPGAWQIVAGDFNRDGILDIVTANRSSMYVDDCSGGVHGKTWDTVSILTGVGDGTFRPARNISIGDQSDPLDWHYRNRVVSLNTNDVNADGSTDLIASFGAILFNAPAAANAAPTVTSPGFTTNTSEIILQATASDADQDMLSWSWSDSAGFEFARWPNVCSMGGLLHPGANVFTVTVSDGHGHTASDAVTVQYEPPADDAFVTILAPVQNGVVEDATPLTIRWMAPASIAAEHLAISVSLDGGRTYTDIDGCTNVRADAGACTWSQPGPPTGQVWLYAATRDGDVYATGFSGPFAIRPAEPGALPPPWRQGDVGTVGAAGGASYADGVFTVKGSGADVFGTVDAFHFVHQTFSGCGIDDMDAIAHVDSVENVHRWTRAGLMVRAGLDASAAHAAIFITPGKGVAFQRRRVAGGESVNTSGPSLTAPLWLRLSIRGTRVVGYYKVDAADSWTRLGDDLIASPCAGQFSDVGLAVVSKEDGTLATAGFSSVSIVRWSPQWTTSLIGSAAGSAEVVDGAPQTQTLTNRGADIWGAGDQFTFLNADWYGDGTIATRVERLTNTHPAAKAGVMIRASRAFDAPHVMLVVQPGKGIAMQYRSQTGGSSAQIAQIPGAAPVTLRLTRSGSVFVGQWSTDGAAWTTIGSIIMPMARDAFAGLALSSHDANTTATATFTSSGIQR